MKKLFLLPILVLTQGCAFNSGSYLDMGHDDQGVPIGVKIKYSQRAGFITPSATVVAAINCHNYNVQQDGHIIASGDADLETMKVCDESTLQTHLIEGNGIGGKVLTAAAIAGGAALLRPDSYRSNHSVDNSSDGSTATGGTSEATGGASEATGGSSNALGGSSSSKAYGGNSSSNSRSLNLNNNSSRTSLKASNHNLNLEYKRRGH